MELVRPCSVVLERLNDEKLVRPCSVVLERLNGQFSNIGDAAISTLTEQLLKKGLKIVKISGRGGHCLYRTLAHKQYNDPKQHQKVRMDLANFISCNPLRYNKQTLGGGELSRLIQEITSGEWGGYETLDAAARLYDKHIIAHAPSGQTVTYVPEGMGSGTWDIVYNGSDHYNSTEVIQDLHQQVDETQLLAPIPRGNQPVQVCHYWQRGHCVFGDSCQDLHLPLKEIHQNLNPNCLTDFRVNYGGGRPGRRSEEERLIQDSKQKVEEENPFKCSICQEKFSTVQNLHGHIEQTHKKNPLSLEMISSDSATEGTLENEEDTLKEAAVRLPWGRNCEFCDGRRQFFNTFIERYERKQTGEKPFKCESCSQNFTKVDDLVAHDRIHHSNEKQYKCKVCSTRFTGNERRVRNSDKRPYKCNVCRKRFNQMGNLKVHKRVHTGVRPYKCDVCSKAFKRMDHLKSHERARSHRRKFRKTIQM